MPVTYSGKKKIVQLLKPLLSIHQTNHNKPATNINFFFLKKM